MKATTFIVPIFAGLMLTACTTTLPESSTTGGGTRTGTTTGISTGTTAIATGTTTTSTGADVSAWYVNEKFTNDLPVSNRPEEGGPSFLIISQDKTADYKIGDIVERMSWSVEGNTLTLDDQRMGNKITFKIEGSQLIDQYGTKWHIAQ